MKKLLLVAVVTTFGLSNAQMTKGDWVFSGNTGAGFNQVNTKFKAEGLSADGPKQSIFTFSPSVGYFVIDKLAIGLEANLLSNTTKYDGDKESMTLFSILPNATYYFTNDSKVIPYLGAGIGYGSIKNKSTYAGSSITDEETTDGLAWKVKGGLTYMATQSLGINLGLSYDQFSNKETYDNIDYKTNVNTLGINIGFSYFLKSKQQKTDK